jgi:hypothetical protein
MSTHIARDVAERLATALAAKAWVSLGNTTTEVVMRRKPDYALDDLGSLVVSTVPGPVNWTTETRQMETAEVTVGIVIAKHVGSEADIAALEDFEQEVVDQIRSGHVYPASLADGSDWTEIANPVPYDPEALDARNVFLGQITVTYRIPQDRV